MGSGRIRNRRNDSSLYRGRPFSPSLSVDHMISLYVAARKSGDLLAHISAEQYFDQAAVFCRTRCVANQIKLHNEFDTGIESLPKRVWEAKI